MSKLKAGKSSPTAVSKPSPTTKYVAPDRDLPLEGLRHSITPADMHYSLRRSDLPEVNLEEWRLKVGGLVSHPMSLSLDEIKARPAVTRAVTLECGGNGRRRENEPRRLGQVSTSEWTGTPLRGVLEEAGVNSKAVEILFTALDLRVLEGRVQLYHSSLSIAEATREGVLLVYAMNGELLPLDHGFPLRLVVSGWYGMVSVRWLDSIEALAEPFTPEAKYGAWPFPVPETLLSARALMIPPGLPDPVTDIYRVKAGLVTLAGKAWVGRLSISRVEVSMDGGATWSEAHLAEEISPDAWRGWSLQWEACPGKYTLYARATDTEGKAQPLTAEGKGKSNAQRIEVIVD